MGNSCPSGFLLVNKQCVYDCSQDGEWFRTVPAQPQPRCTLRTSLADGFPLTPLPLAWSPTLDQLRARNPSLYEQYQAEQRRVQEKIASLNADPGKTLRDVTRSLKPFRPPTAPASDKAIERNAILSGTRSLIVIQLALFILLAVLVAYLVLPPSYANGVAFLLLCGGVAYGFFLQR